MDIYLLWFSVPIRCHPVSYRKLAIIMQLGFELTLAAHRDCSSCCRPWSPGSDAIAGGARGTTRDEITLRGQDIGQSNQPAHNSMSDSREDRRGC